MSNSYSVGRGIGVGAISGVIAGAVMLPVMMVTNTMMGNPALVFQTMTGMMMGQGIATAAGVGIGLHMLASTIIGIIFGAITSSDRLRLTGFRKGVGLGVATGMIAFVVLFLPLMMTVLPPQMVGLMHMMNPQVPTTMIMQNIQAAMPMMIGGSILVHIVYGAVLGIVATAMIYKRKSYECSLCHMKFKNEIEFSEHKEQQRTQKH